MNRLGSRPQNTKIVAEIPDLACAGSMYCFRVADAYLKGFLPVRTAVVTGNHDLEGEDFETDEANLAAWTKVSRTCTHLCNGLLPKQSAFGLACPWHFRWMFILTQSMLLLYVIYIWGCSQVFKQRHYWSMELGNVICLGISTVRFRSNAFRCSHLLLQASLHDTLCHTAEEPISSP